jgi:hypothetical protein
MTSQEHGNGYNTDISGRKPLSHPLGRGRPEPALPVESGSVSNSEGNGNGMQN